jgi:hypothetical protein
LDVIAGEQPVSRFGVFNAGFRLNGPRQRAKFPIIYPDLRLDYKVATDPVKPLWVKGISIAKQVTLVLAVWFAIAVFSSASGATLALRPPFPQVVLCGLLGLLFVPFGYLKAFRSWLYAIPLHSLVAVLILRFVGAYFLIL